MRHGVPPARIRRPRRPVPLLALAALLAGCPDEPTGGPRLPVEFPDEFTFGFATVAYQSEGTLLPDGGRVSSNWSEWEDLGQIRDGSRNDRGNGFYDGYAADFERAASLGATSFSYAVDWARLEPEPGVFDDAELARVVEIVTSIRDHGMKPLIILFHWVTPSWVQSPASGVDLLAQDDDAFVDAFLPLVERVVPALDGLVDEWVTFEEPYSIVGASYLLGFFPPGGVFAVDDMNRALVNLMYLHARAYRRIKELDTADADGDGLVAEVGLENAAYEMVPLDPESDADIAAAERVNYAINRQFFEAVLHGDIDLDLDGAADNDETVPPERHDESLAPTLDFIGINYYARWRVEDEPGLLPYLAYPHIDTREYDNTRPHSDLYYEISPGGLRTIIEEYSRWDVPLVVTENGIADADGDQRPFFVLDHLRVLGEALADGYDVRGYYAWTISDNFEWAEGQRGRYGYFTVDYDDPALRRTRTAAADVYAGVAASRRIDRALWERFALPAYPVGIP